MQSAGSKFDVVLSLTSVKMLSALPGCTAKPILCSSQQVTLLYPVASVTRLSLSDMSTGLKSPYTPAVSTATGSNMKRAPCAPYFLRFRFSAFRPACSINTTELQMLISAQVVSLYKHLQLKNGNTVIPSCLLPFLLSTFTDFKVEGTTAFCRPRSMIAFRAACVGCSLVLTLQESQ